MTVATPTSQSAVNSPNSTYPSTIAISRDAAPATGRGEESSTLWRTILDAHGGQILEYASDQFLDRAVSRRLKSIKTRDLVNLLANAERLGYKETDIVGRDETVHIVHEIQARPRSSLDTAGTLIRPGERVGHRGSDPSDPPRLLDIEGPRDHKRLKTNGHGSLLVTGKSDHEPDTKIGAYFRSMVPLLPQRSVSKRSCVQFRGGAKRGPQKHSALSRTEPPRGVSTRHVEFVVISDSEPAGNMNEN